MHCPFLKTPPTYQNDWHVRQSTVQIIHLEITTHKDPLLHEFTFLFASNPFVKPNRLFHPSSNFYAIIEIWFKCDFVNIPGLLFEWFTVPDIHEYTFLCSNTNRRRKSSNQLFPFYLKNPLAFVLTWMFVLSQNSFETIIPQTVHMEWKKRLLDKFSDYCFLVLCYF